MSKTKGLLFTAGVALATAFTFSCSSGDGEDPNPSSSSDGSGGNSSSSTGSGGGYTGSYGSLPYGEKTYKTVVIGTQTWMAENLDYAVEGSKCYNDKPENCTKYGRLYNWATAMDIDASYNRTSWNGNDANHQGICPDGWHLPSDRDWGVLINHAGGSTTAGTKLKSTSGWDDCNGTDEFGFSALPGGFFRDDHGFGSFGSTGSWWSASQEEGRSNFAYMRQMNYTSEIVLRDRQVKSYLISVRCVKD